MKDSNTIPEWNVGMDQPKGSFHISRRLEPPEGVKAKLGDRVVYEIIYDDGQLATLTTYIDKFDLMMQG